MSEKEGGAKSAREQRAEFLRNRKSGGNSLSRGNGTGSDSRSGSRSVDQGQADRGVSTSGSSDDGQSIVRPSETIISGNEGATQPSRNDATGLSGNRDESPTERRNRLRRERYAQKRIESGHTVNSRRSDYNEPESDGNTDEGTTGHSVNDDFSITTEVPILTAPPNASTKPVAAKPRTRRSKVKEPDKATVSLIASSMQDIYELFDGAAGMMATMYGKQYPDGLLSLDEKKAEKMAYALSQMNEALPKVAEKVNKVSAPLAFASVLIGDLALKGALLYGVFKQPSKPNN